MAVANRKNLYHFTLLHTFLKFDTHLEANSAKSFQNVFLTRVLLKSCTCIFRKLNF